MAVFNSQLKNNLESFKFIWCIDNLEFIGNYAANGRMTSSLSLSIKEFCVRAGSDKVTYERQEVPLCWACLMQTVKQ